MEKRDKLFKTEHRNKDQQKQEHRGRGNWNSLAIGRVLGCLPCDLRVYKKGSESSRELDYTSYL